MNLAMSIKDSGLSVGEVAGAINNFIDDLYLKFTRTAMPDARFRMALDRVAAKRIRKVLLGQMKWLTKNIDRLPPFSAKSVYRLERKTLNSEIDDFLSGMPGNPSLVKAIITSSGAAMLKGGRTRIKKTGLAKFGSTFSLKNPDAIRYLKGVRDFQLSQASGTIDHVTKMRIKDILVDSAENGLSYTETSRRIQEQATAGVFSQSRGELIATRETGIAYEKGNRIVMDDFTHAHPEATVLKKWATVNDDRVTPTHTQNQDDGLIPMAQAFSGTGDQEAPGSDNPRCRCATDYEVVI
jgi:hypothetical protein